MQGAQGVTQGSPLGCSPGARSYKGREGHGEGSGRAWQRQPLRYRHRHVKTHFEIPRGGSDLTGSPHWLLPPTKGFSCWNSVYVARGLL